MKKIIEVAEIVFYDDYNRLLLQGREGISKFGEEWTFFGGRLEAGETPKQALTREIKEELEYELKEYRFLMYQKQEMTEEITTIQHIYIGDAPELSEVNLREGSDIRFFTIEEARKLKKFPRDNEIIKEFEKNKNIT
ncbi:MAG: NUDIX domain-containing protein [Nanobdellota archaeon]